MIIGCSKGWSWQVILELVELLASTSLFSVARVTKLLGVNKQTQTKTETIKYKQRQHLQCI